MRSFLLLLSLVSYPFGLAAADEHVGTLTQLEGLVQIFSHPSKTLPSVKPAAGTLALFEGEYYVVNNAKAGDPVENGNIVRTVPGAKARVVFENGDLFQIGSGTAYRVSWNAKAVDRAKLQAKIDLMYGKFRGVVAKDGPRKKITLRSPVAVMGVRGTDFFVEENGRTGETEFTVIRGAVEVTPTGHTKPIEVKSGFSAVVAMKTTVMESAPSPAASGAPAKTETAAKPAPAPEVKVELRRTAQDELRAIQKTSELKSVPVAAPAITAKVEALEKKALESTLKDIHEYQPELHARLSAKAGSSGSLESVNAESVNALLPTAPKEAPHRRRKPVIKDLDSADEAGAYDRYFKKVE